LLSKTHEIDRARKHTSLHTVKIVTSINTIFKFNFTDTLTCEKIHFASGNNRKKHHLPICLLYATIHDRIVAPNKIYWSCD
jgi:hypothetical protein